MLSKTKWHRLLCVCVSGRWTSCTCTCQTSRHCWKFKVFSFHWAMSLSITITSNSIIIMITHTTKHFHVYLRANHSILCSSDSVSVCPWSFCLPPSAFWVIDDKHSLEPIQIEYIYAIVTFACCFIYVLHIHAHFQPHFGGSVAPRCIHAFKSWISCDRVPKENFAISSWNYQVDVIIIENFRTFAAEQLTERTASSAPLTFILDFGESSHKVNHEIKWMHRIIRKFLLWIVDFIFEEYCAKYRH